MKTRHFKVAGHEIALRAEEEIFGMLTNYEPFAVSDDGNFVFLLNVTEDTETPHGFFEELRQEDEGREIICGHIGEHPAFVFRCLQKMEGWLVCSTDYREARLTLTGQQRKYVVDNSLMILYALATAGIFTALFHASVVSKDECGYMFLGPSGIGKSTHSALWLKYVNGAMLVNDDNPVVRAIDGQIRVYGSPWSGKTQCYRNVNYPLGGIVMLSQASRNHIRKLQDIEAYAALVSSISGKRWDKTVADGLHKTENLLASSIRVWSLECRPDEAAAKLCSETII